MMVTACNDAENNSNQQRPLRSAKLSEVNAVCLAGLAGIGRQAPQCLLPLHADLQLRLFTTGCGLGRANDEPAHSSIKPLRNW